MTTMPPHSPTGVKGDQVRPSSSLMAGSSRIQTRPHDQAFLSRRWIDHSMERRNFTTRLPVVRHRQSLRPRHAPIIGSLVTDSAFAMTFGVDTENRLSILKQHRRWMTEILTCFTIDDHVTSTILIQIQEWQVISPRWHSSMEFFWQQGASKLPGLLTFQNNLNTNDLRPWIHDQFATDRHVILTGAQSSGEVPFSSSEQRIPTTDPQNDVIERRTFDHRVMQQNPDRSIRQLRHVQNRSPQRRRLLYRCRGLPPEARTMQNDRRCPGSESIRSTESSDNAAAACESNPTGLFRLAIHPCRKHQSRKIDRAVLQEFRMSTIIRRRHAWNNAEQTERKQQVSKHAGMVTGLMAMPESQMQMRYSDVHETSQRIDCSRAHPDQ